MKRTFLFLLSRVTVMLVMMVFTTINMYAEGEWKSGDCTVTLKDSVLTVSGSGKMADYMIPDIREWEFQKDSIWYIIIGKDVTSVGENAFTDLPKLRTVDFTGAKALNSIGRYSFGHCTRLTSIVLPDNLESIGPGSFEACTGLETVTIPASVSSIGLSAFRDCSNITSITIPAAVTRINEKTFYGCSSLKSVIFAEGTKLDAIGHNVFEGTALTTFTIPASVTVVGSEAFKSCPALTAINVEAGNTTYSSIDGVLFHLKNQYLDVYPAGKPGESYEVADGVICILSNAFEGNKALKSVTIPASVETIGGEAFHDCSNLASVTIYGNKAFGRDIFKGIKDDAMVKLILQGITMGDVSWLAFHNCYYSVEAEDNTKLFKAKVTDDGVLLTEMKTDKVVPESTGVVLKKMTPGDYELKFTTKESGNDYAGNELQGEDFPIAGIGNYYYLDNKAQGFGFFKITLNDRINIGTAFLSYTPAEGATAPAMFTVSETSSGIRAIDRDAMGADAAVFDLQGRRQHAIPVPKGVYIRGGQKFVVR